MDLYSRKSCLTRKEILVSSHYPSLLTCQYCFPIDLHTSVEPFLYPDPHKLQTAQLEMQLDLQIHVKLYQGIIDTESFNFTSGRCNGIECDLEIKRPIMSDHKFMNHHGFFEGSPHLIYSIFFGIRALIGLYFPNWNNSSCEMLMNTFMLYSMKI